MDVLDFGYLFDLYAKATDGIIREKDREIVGLKNEINELKG